MAQEDRRTRIADAVIRTLAERGSRGLTHRAVDEAAGLPTGSTSYYFRSRADLVACAVPRLAELDAADLDGLDDEGDPAAALTAVVRSGLRGDGRARTLARYELVLEAGRRPELQEALAAGTERMLALLRGVVGADPSAGTPGSAEARAADLLAFLDGLLLAGVTSPPARRRTASDIEQSIARFLSRS
jgi:DNA-binding transcriptional regulator YbjK